MWLYWWHTNLHTTQPCQKVEGKALRSRKVFPPTCNARQSKKGFCSSKRSSIELSFKYSPSSKHCWPACASGQTPVLLFEPTGQSSPVPSELGATGLHKSAPESRDQSLLVQIKGILQLVANLICDCMPSEWHVRQTTARPMAKPAGLG